MSGHPGAQVTAPTPKVTSYTLTQAGVNPLKDAASLEPWYTALRSSVGVCIRVSDKKLAIQRLYAARKAALDPALDSISIVQSPTADDELWLIKRTSNASET